MPPVVLILLFFVVTATQVRSEPRGISSSYKVATAFCCQRHFRAYLYIYASRRLYIRFHLQTPQKKLAFYSSVHLPSGLDACIRRPPSSSSK